MSYEKRLVFRNDLGYTDFGVYDSGVYRGMMSDNQLILLLGELGFMELVRISQASEDDEAAVTFNMSVEK